MREFYYRFIGSGNSYGPMRAENEKAARKRIADLWRDDFKDAGKRMRFETWETSPEEREQVQRNYRETYHSQYACE